MSTAASDEQRTAEVRKAVEGWKGWKQKFELHPGVTTPGEHEVPNVARYLAENFNIKTLKGKRVLDIGTIDGGWAFAMEALGADVTASDARDPLTTGFATARAAIASRMRFFNVSIYDLDPAVHGTFDMVHCSWAMYRLKHPMLALEKINGVMKKDGILFGHGISGEVHYRTRVRSRLAEWVFRRYVNKLPIAYMLDGTFGGDRGNWMLFNDECLATMFERCGFAVEFVRSEQSPFPHTLANARYKCFKRSEPEKDDLA